MIENTERRAIHLTIDEARGYGLLPADYKPRHPDWKRGRMKRRPQVWRPDGGVPSDAYTWVEGWINGPFGVTERTLFVWERCYLLYDGDRHGRDYFDSVGAAMAFAEAEMQKWQSDRKRN